MASKYKSSYLFDSRTAANYDNETIRQLGIDGLNELINQGLEQFIQFKELFGDQLKDFDRTLKTPAENAQISSLLENFLLHLSPYFLTKPAAKCIEWLVRRFRVNELDVESVMKCIVGYLEARQSVPLIAILKIK